MHDFKKKLNGSSFIYFSTNATENNRMTSVFEARHKKCNLRMSIEEICNLL